MAIQQRSRRASVFLVIRVVNQLRRRLKPRVSSLSTKSPSLGSKLCLGLEAEALRNIEKGLAHSPQGRKHLQHWTKKRICKSRKDTRPWLKLQTPGWHESVRPNTSGEEVQHTLLNALNGNISPVLTPAVCSSDELFLLKQNGASNFDGGTLNEIIRSLVVVFDALCVLHQARTLYDDAWLVAQGSEHGLSFDEAFIANYEHILLRLQSELLAALARKVVETLMENDVDKRQRRLLTWFTEFIGIPFCNTFSWNIEPSLAVLWGVCWCFYYPTHQSRRPERTFNSNNHSSNNNSNRIPRARLLQDVRFPAPRPDEYLNFGLQLTGTHPQPATQQQRVGGVDPLGASHGCLWAEAAVPEFDLSPAGLGRGNVIGPPVSPLRHAGGGRHAPQFVGLGSLSPAAGTTYTQALQGHPSLGDIASVPTNPSIATSPIFAFPQQDINFDNFDNPDQTWALTHRHLPPQPGHVTAVPALRLNGNGSPDSVGFAQPPGFASSFLYQPPPQASHLNINNANVPNYGQSSYNMGIVQPPESASLHITPAPKHERTSSINSTTNMPTPVSLPGGRSPAVSPVSKRRMSIPSPHDHQRMESEERSSQDEDDALSPHRNHSYKRAEDPPRNPDGKMVCKHKECNDVTFERKCEWSKHMDKHDRPYKCNVKGCEKLQGFTYSGGLLRHEREVHKMHGGTKKSLFCPFTDCKRSSGAGFTRKENLAEHIRRVHRRTSMSVDMGHLIIPRQDRHDEVSDHRLPSESPYSRPVDISEETSLLAKRKRISDAGIPEEGDESGLHAEVKRLRRENEEKDSRLRQLEAAVMALQQGHQQSRRLPHPERATEL